MEMEILRHRNRYDRLFLKHIENVFRKTHPECCAVATSKEMVSKRFLFLWPGLYAVVLLYSNLLVSEISLKYIELSEEVMWSFYALG